MISTSPRMAAPNTACDETSATFFCRKYLLLFGPASSRAVFNANVVSTESLKSTVAGGTAQGCAPGLTRDFLDDNGVNPPTDTYGALCLLPRLLESESTEDDAIIAFSKNFVHTSMCLSVVFSVLTLSVVMSESEETLGARLILLLIWVLCSKLFSLRRGTS